MAEIIGDRRQILVAKKYDEQDSHYLSTPDMQALKVNITTGGPGISVIGGYQSPRPTSVEGGELFLF